MSNVEKNANIINALFSPVAIVTALTTLNLIIALAIVVLGLETEQAQSLMNTCVDCSKVGFGAIAGLMGASRNQKKSK